MPQVFQDQGLIRVFLAAATVFSAAAAAAAAHAGDPVQGAYLAAVAGCASCHTDVEGRGRPYAGGPALTSDFGTFRAPNITSDPDYGIGTWSEDDFVRALKRGVSPGGQPYYPAFPYVSYARMTDQDARDLHAYFRTVEPVPEAGPDHDLAFPFSVRLGLWAWRLLYFDPADASLDTASRGGYLANALAHCGECHTPRNRLGALRTGMAMAGARLGDGDVAGNLTPDPDTGLDWDATDLRFFLQTGLTPDGDAAGGAMALVVEHSTGKMTPEDLEALVTWLKGLPPVRNALTTSPSD